jgi:hypothetical protein
MTMGPVVVEEIFDGDDERDDKGEAKPLDSD